MAALSKICRTCGSVTVDEILCECCGADPNDEPAYPDSQPDPETPESETPESETPESETLEIVLAGVRTRVLADESVVLGREGDDEIAGACAAFNDVSRRHAMVSARSGGVVEVCDLDSLNGTFVGAERLAPHAHRLLALPTTIRLARNCYVGLQIAPPTPEASWSEGFE